MVNRWVWSINQIAPCRNKERQEDPHPKLPASNRTDAQNKTHEIPVVCLGQALSSGSRKASKRPSKEADPTSRGNQSLMGYIAQRGQYVNKTLLTPKRPTQFSRSKFPCKAVATLLRSDKWPSKEGILNQSSFLKSRKHFRKHYIERDSPRINRRKNRQQFPRKDHALLEKVSKPIRSGDPVPLSEIISEVIEILIRGFESASHLEQSSKTGSQIHRGRR